MKERELISIKGTIMSPQNQHENDIDPWKRATAQAPNNYTPSAVDCSVILPSIRNATSLSVDEKTWLQLRRNNTVWSIRDFLARANITGLDTNKYIDNLTNNASAFPIIGIAISGGGYRALMNGAGAIAAFDNRTINSTSQGHLGGLLQASTYISGLSGGSWLVGSLYVNNFTSVQDIVNTNPNASGSLWEFSNSILQGYLSPCFQMKSFG
jgi:lysophospholipase